MHDDRYDDDPIARMRPRRGPVARREVPAAPGLLLEHALTEFFGEVLDAREGVIRLRDFDGAVRSFPLGDGFLVDGEVVRLVQPRPGVQPRRRTASGSFAAPLERARVAQASRIFVEGVHDAELVEQVWGADLRAEGIVVELLEGADRLEAVLAEFGPERGRRAGVLLDHLVAGSKESRIAETVARGLRGEHVRIVGHPYIDIWEAVKPARLGLQAWPRIPRDTDWKTGVCRALGWPAAEHADIADAWARIRSRVRDFRDLEPELVGRVEELIDFVTAGEPAGESHGAR